MTHCGNFPAVSGLSVRLGQTLRPGQRSPDQAIGSAISTTTDISSYGEAGSRSTDLVRAPAMARLEARRE